MDALMNRKAANQVGNPTSPGCREVHRPLVVNKMHHHGPLVSAGGCNHGGSVTTRRSPTQISHCQRKSKHIFGTAILTRIELQKQHKFRTTCAFMQKCPADGLAACVTLHLHLHSLVCFLRADGRPASHWGQSRGNLAAVGCLAAHRQP